MQHHARLYIAENLQAATLPEEYCTPATDVVHIVSDAFGIDAARQLIEDANRRPLEGGYRTFIIAFKSATTEAQNALLKLFEEPPETSRFMVVVPRVSALIPTLLSRLQVEEVELLEQDNINFKDFLQMDYKDRLEKIAWYAKSKDQEWFNSIRSGLVEYGSLESKLSKAAKVNVSFVSSLLGTRGASNKMLLEELALSLPVGASFSK